MRWRDTQPLQPTEIDDRLNIDDLFFSKINLNYPEVNFRSFGYLGILSSLGPNKCVQG